MGYIVVEASGICTEAKFWVSEALCVLPFESIGEALVKGAVC